MTGEGLLFEILLAPKDRELLASFEDVNGLASSMKSYAMDRVDVECRIPRRDDITQGKAL